MTSEESKGKGEGTYRRTDCQKIDPMRPALPLLLAATCLADTSGFLGGSTPRGKGGKAIFRMENGELVGEAVAKSANTFLCTDKAYGDFVLEYDFKVDPRLNSGVQIRSQCLDAPSGYVDAAGKPQSIPAGKVHGYQIEIDTDPSNQGNRQWTAGLYEEGRRGWLVPGLLGGDTKAFTEQGRRLTKVGEWNHVRIEAVGPRIRTWLNGELRVDAMDGDATRGFIGFQVHAVPEALAGTQNRWREVRLTEVAPNTLTETEKSEGWTLLFDGASTEGWRAFRGETFPSKGWTVRDGTLTVLKAGGGGDIVTRRAYKAFELAVEFRVTPGANSGIMYFTQDAVVQGNAVRALEFQVLDDERHADAKRGRDGNRTVGSLYDLCAPGPAKLTRPAGEWNHALVRTSSDGRKVEHWLNGRLVVSYDRDSEAFRAARAASKFTDPKYGAGFGEWAEGRILLQDHGDEVAYRSVKVRAAAQGAAK